jgi:hypothetical protein
MQNQFEISAIKITDAGKKEWSAPVFEIISKEIVQSGAAGAEGASTPGLS